MTEEQIILTAPAEHEFVVIDPLTADEQTITVTEESK